MDEDKKVNKRSDIEANMEGISKSIQILMEGCRNIAKAHIIENVSTVVSGISKILSTMESNKYFSEENNKSDGIAGSCESFFEIILF